MHQIEGTASSMSGFTTDFFGALDTTFTDNSFNNNSKLEMSQSICNKSHLHRQLREDSAVKIAQLLQKLLTMTVFDQLYLLSIRKRRREENTPLNMHKHTYKMQLLLNMKNRSKLQWAFHRITKFIQEFDMRDTANHNQFLTLQQCNIQPTNQIALNNRNLNIADDGEDGFNAYLQDKSQDGEGGGDQKFVRVGKFVEILQNVVGDEMEIRKAFDCLRSNQFELQKKSYLIEILMFYTKLRMRTAFVQLQHCPKPKINSFKKLLKKPIEEYQYHTIAASQKRKQLNVERTESKEQFKQHESRSERNSLNEYLTSKNKRSSSKSRKKFANPDLKFNKNVKKTSISELKIKGPNELPAKEEAVQLKPAQLISRKTQTWKAIKCELELSEEVLPVFAKFTDFPNLKTLYYVAAQDLKREIPDEQDQPLDIKACVPPLKTTLSSSFLNSQSQASLPVPRQDNSLSKRIHKLQQKKPLQFSKQKRRLHSNRSNSKNSIISSDCQSQSNMQEIVKERGPMNLQSLHSYYFPESNGKLTERSITNKDIKPNEPDNKDRRKRRKKSSIDSEVKREVSPYQSQLMDRAPKISDQAITFNKMVETRRSSSKNSKNTKEEANRSDKQQDQSSVRRTDQIKSERQNSLSAQVQHSRSPKFQATSPTGRTTNQQKTSQPQVPKQWCLHGKDGVLLASPPKSNPIGLQFQKVAGLKKKAGS